MMREILFRGKTYDGEWENGSLLIQWGEMTNDGEREREYLILGMRGESRFVIPETVGQYTGLKNENGKRIFEGDIVRAQDNLIFSPFCDGLVGKVVYIETAFFIEPKDPTKSEYLFNECAIYEVLGNIHDNPELMEVR